MAVALAVAGQPLAASAEGLGNEVFFRGGWAALTSDRGNELFTDVHGQSIGSTSQTGKNGYYIGAGLDLMLSRDVWGLMKGISVVGEIGVEYKRWNSDNTFNTGNIGVNGTGALAVGGAGAPAGTSQSKTPLTMLTVDVAPKIKFMEGSNFQPWVIPVGLDFHVISPPSNTTTVLDVGVQFGAGAEYRLWKELKVGLDGRFHLASGATGTVNNFGTLGGYVGIGF
jgi:opacity protein-like surface antigen